MVTRWYRHLVWSAGPPSRNRPSLSPVPSSFFRFFSPSPLFSFSLVHFAVEAQPSVDRFQRFRGDIDAWLWVALFTREHSILLSLNDRSLLFPRSSPLVPAHHFTARLRDSRYACVLSSHNYYFTRHASSAHSASLARSQQVPTNDIERLASVDFVSFLCKLPSLVDVSYISAGSYTCSELATWLSLMYRALRLSIKRKHPISVSLKLIRMRYRCVRVRLCNDLRPDKFANLSTWHTREFINDAAFTLTETRKRNCKIN